MLKHAVYALDSITIDLCLSMFNWAAFRRTGVAVKLRTVLDLRGSIPTFIHISDGKLHDVNLLDLVDPEASAFSMSWTVVMCISSECPVSWGLITPAYVGQPCPLQLSESIETRDEFAIRPIVAVAHVRAGSPRILRCERDRE
jgi:hypothetical protein